jgi:beta-glucosidase
MPSPTHDIVTTRVDELLKQLTLREKVSLLAGKDTWRTVPIPRLGIPSITMTDGPHGVRSSVQEAGRKASTTTCFPTGVSFASTWNTALIKRVGAALAEETRAMDCEILLGPCVNIVRHPLAGRNFEAYSEDPYLAGKIGSAWVGGLQSKNVGASLKHYACNNQEEERGRGSSNLDERTLREIYLPHFEMVVKETQPWTVMCSYNRINGVYASENNHLLREILKDEWGFEGFVVSDWGANHTIVDSVKNGLDLEMPGPTKYYGQLLEDSINNWQLDETAVDEAVRRILRIVILSGKMDGDTPAGSVNTPEHQALAREVAEEAVVLLKNNNSLLPLKADRLRSIAVIGPNAAEDRIGGGGSSFVDPPYRVSPLQALQARLGEKVAYEKGCDNWTEPPAIGQDLLKPLTADGQGLKVEFFDNPDLAGDVAGEMFNYKTDNWLWVGSLLFAGVTQPRFSLRTTGTIVPLETGRYTFTFRNSGLCRLYLNDVLVLEHNALTVHLTSTSEDSASYTCRLEAGVETALKIEYLKANDENFAFLRLALAPTAKPEGDDRISRAAALAARSDVALVFAGMHEGFESEGHDRPDMRLPGPQVELIRAVAQANPNTIVILNAGSPVEMPWIDQVSAVLEAFYPGQEGGNAIARILLGEVNPSGKLSETFPIRLEDTPAYINYPGIRDVHYGEGIFVGYRYYDKKDVAPLFPFGHGLSYTHFEYSDLNTPAAAKAGAAIPISLTVRNSGDVAGKEIVQVYVRDMVSTLVRPIKELKGFTKVDLQPGQSAQVSFELDSRAFAFFDPYKNQWVVEPGEFEILVGSSSQDLRLSGRLSLE